MSPFFVLADHYARQALSGYAHSALPNAPVLPYVERPRRIRRLAGALRNWPRRLSHPRPAPTQWGRPTCTCDGARN